MAYVEFGEWLPDLPAYRNEGVTLVKGVRPAGKSYISFPSSATYTGNAMDNPPQGGYSTRDRDGNVYYYFGNNSKLYEMLAASFTDVAKVGGYNTGSEEIWEFATWDNQVIATNYSDPIQEISMGAAAFADLAAGIPPKCRHLAVYRDFLILGNINDSVVGKKPNRVQWSGLGDIETWSVDVATQADYEDLEDSGGWIQKIVAGDNCYIFREYAIHTMSYVGSPTIFQIDKIENAVGLLSPRSLVSHGRMYFYLGRDGFYVFDGRQSVPIGTNRINNFFFDDVDLNYPQNIQGAIDYKRQIIYWAYPGSGNVNGRCNRIIMFNFSKEATKRWSYIDSIDVSFFGTTLSEGYTLDGLDAVNIDLDALPYSLDSRIWMGNNTIISGVNSTNEMVNFEGTAIAATIETQEMQIFENSNAVVTNVRPIIDGSASVGVYVGTRNNLNEAVTWSALKVANAAGLYPTRERARYHRFRITTDGDFNHAQGIEVVNATKEGIR
jgi:predicted nuclease of predicted toxin-antitoxin system